MPHRESARFLWREFVYCHAWRARYKQRLAKAIDVANESVVILVAGEEPNARGKTVQKLRDGLGQVLIVEANTMWEAARQCEQLSHLDFIVLDNELVESVGTGFLSGLSALQPGARLMVFGPPRARAAAIKMLEAGAAAYLPSDLAPADIAKAFGLVLSGAVFAPIPPVTRLAHGAGMAPRAVVVPFPGRKPDAAHLSAGQRDVLALLARGRSNAEIAFLLGLTESAVKTQVVALMQRIGVDELANAKPPFGAGDLGPRPSEPEQPQT